MSEEQKIRVVIADDQELVRAGFAMVIGSQPDMAVVGQARDGAEAVALAETLHPDVVLMDVRMPGVDGIEATRRISALQHRFAPDGSALDDAHTRVIILTTFDLDEYVMAAINAGASGFLLKDTEPETLLNSIRTVYQGNAIIAPSATKRLRDHRHRCRPRRPLHAALSGAFHPARGREIRAAMPAQSGPAAAHRRGAAGRAPEDQGRHRQPPARHGPDRGLILGQRHKRPA